MKPRLLEIVPLIPSGGSLAAALAFYTEHMGFSVVWQGEGMAGIRRDGIAFYRWNGTALKSLAFFPRHQVCAR